MSLPACPRSTFSLTSHTPPGFTNYHLSYLYTVTIRLILMSFLQNDDLDDTIYCLALIITIIDHNSMLVTLKWNCFPFFLQNKVHVLDLNSSWRGASTKVLEACATELDNAITEHRDSLGSEWCAGEFHWEKGRRKVNYIENNGKTCTNVCIYVYQRHSSWNRVLNFTVRCLVRLVEEHYFALTWLAYINQRKWHCFHEANVKWMPFVSQANS